MQDVGYPLVQQGLLCDRLLRPRPPADRPRRRDAHRVVVAHAGVPRGPEAVQADVKRLRDGHLVAEVNGLMLWQLRLGVLVLLPGGDLVLVLGQPGLHCLREVDLRLVEREVVLVARPGGHGVGALVRVENPVLGSGEGVQQLPPALGAQVSQEAREGLGQIHGARGAGVQRHVRGDPVVPGVVAGHGVCRVPELSCEGRPLLVVPDGHQVEHPLPVAHAGCCRGRDHRVHQRAHAPLTSPRDPNNGVVHLDQVWQDLRSPRQPRRRRQRRGVPAARRMLQAQDPHCLPVQGGQVLHPRHMHSRENRGGLRHDLELRGREALQARARTTCAAVGQRLPPTPAGTRRGPTATGKRPWQTP
mmetsp:Transcript_30619/g.87461  ORF Transcript_30619/g.87461 Transcript_30619/m.87461 type:complete len:359 (+) Transcript_30619:491-1567(+)